MYLNGSGAWAATNLIHKLHGRIHVALPPLDKRHAPLEYQAVGLLRQ
jgi:hypothetical protein